MQDFRKLLVWQKARALAVRLDEVLPAIQKKNPRLADQLERAIESVAANIAEGCGRETKKDFKHFLTMAIGSTTETENHLIRAHDKGLLTTHNCAELTNSTIEARKMLNGLRNSLG